MRPSFRFPGLFEKKGLAWLHQVTSLKLVKNVSSLKSWPFVMLGSMNLERTRSEVIVDSTEFEMASVLDNFSKAFRNGDGAKPPFLASTGILLC